MPHDVSSHSERNLTVIHERSRVTSAQVKALCWVITNALICLLLIAVLDHFVRNYFRLGQYAMSGFGMAPAWSDEAVYHLNAKYFVTSQGYGDSTIIEELQSRLGHFGPHGPIYSILDGITYSLFGDSFNVKIFSNIAILSACVPLVFSAGGLPIARRFALTLVPVTSFVSVNYLFCYMQEIVHIGLACLLWRAAWGLSRQPVTSKKLVWALPLLLFASAARASWVFITPVFAGLRHASTRCAVVNVSLGLLAVGAALIAFPLFNAAYPVGVLFAIREHLPTGNYAEIEQIVQRNLTRNIQGFFTSPPNEAISYHYNRLFFVACWVFVTLIGLCKKSRFALLASFFGALYFLALVCVYDASDWKEQRALAGPLVFMGLTIVAEVSVLFSSPVLVASVLLGNAAFDGYARQFVTVKKQHAQHLKMYEVPEFLQELRSTIRGGSTEVVLLSASFILHDNKPYLMLPTISDDNTPIRYTLNLIDASWKLHNRIPIRYAVLRPAEATAAGLQADTGNNAYRLFRFPDPPKSQ